MVLFCVRLRSAMVRSFLNRLSGTLKKDMTKDDFRRRATYCYSGENSKPLGDMKRTDVCSWNCYVCGGGFQNSKDTILKGSWHNGCSQTVNSQLKTRERLTLEDVDARCARCWLEERNGKPFAPHVAGFGHKVRYWYHCDVCNHDFQLGYDGMFRNGIWCCYCSPTYKKLCGDVNCQWCWDNSAATHLAQYNLEWLPSNDKEAHQVAKGSSAKKYYYNCLTCNHTLHIPPGKIEGKSDVTCCKYCTHQALCDNDNCEMCKLNSALVYLDRTDLAIISPANREDLRVMFRRSHLTRVRCQCTNDKNHVWDVVLSNLANRGCPHCKHKTESIIMNELLKHFPNTKTQARYEWCKNKTYLPFDFALDNINILIENDGAQHYKDVPIFNKTMSLLDIQERDDYKTKCALDNQYSVIRLVQQNVFSDWKKGKTDWLDSLLAAIETVRVSEEHVSFGYAF